MTDIRPFSPIPMDLALVRRLAAYQLVSDTTIALTRDVNPLEAALLTVVPLADLGFPTLVLRHDDNGYIGQLRHRLGEEYAHLVSVAPIPQADVSQTPWLTLIDGLVATAGRRGALNVIAELSEAATTAFEIFRQAGFIVYGRQMIYHRKPASPPPTNTLKRVRLRVINSQDGPALQALYGRLVPKLLQQAIPMPKMGASRGNTVSIAIESIKDGRLVGYLAMEEGRSGLLIKPLIHPDIFDDVETIIGNALTLWPKAEKLPMYVCVYSYQQWISTALSALGMIEVDRQIIVVKHTVTRVETSFERIPASTERAMGRQASAQS